MMKKYIFGTLLLSAALCAGCSLEETPQSKFSQDEAFKSEKLTYANAVANVYSAIGNGIYGDAGSAIHTLQEFSSDATMLPGRQGDWVDGGKWQNMFLHNFESSVDSYRDVWNHIYKIIGLCNSSIDKLSTYEADNANYKKYIYELRALRALYYYYAMDLWGQVPLVTSSKVSTTEVAQSGRSDVFKFVTTELADCLPHLGDGKNQNPGEYYGRVTQAVAYMCLAKCAIGAPVYTVDATSPDSYRYLVGSDLSKACKADETLGETLSASGRKVMITVDGTERNAWETVKYCVAKIEGLGYSLQPKYADNFIVANETSVENIFVRPDDDVTYRIHDYNMERTLHYNHAGAINYSGWNGACASVRQMQVYGYGTATADPRLKLNFYTDKDYMEQTGKAVPDGATSQDLEYEPLKPVVDFGAGADAHDVKCAGARMRKYELDLKSSAIGVVNNDLVIWRYADALLLKAEAEYRLGDKATALTHVNQVRARVGAEPRTALTLNDILDERMLELSWEGVRRTDQIRFGTFTQPTVDRYPGVKHNASAGDYNDDKTGYTTVYPIPYEVLNLNKNLKQNPGYKK